MAALLSAVLVASLLGSLHCAGMCGVFVAFAVGAGEAAVARRFRLHVAYHGGRLVSYATLGALAGVLGAATDLGGSVIGLGRVAGVVAGAMLVIFGSVALLRVLGVRLPGAASTGLLTRLVQRGQSAAIRWPLDLRALAIGLLSTLLPCGWLYAFAVAAAGTGDPLWGALTMSAFWVGTVPVLASIGVGLQKLTGLFGRRLQVRASLLIVAVGLVTIVGRWDLPITQTRAGNQPPTSVEEATRRVQGLRTEKMPCCDHGS